MAAKALTAVGGALVALGVAACGLALAAEARQTMPAADAELTAAPPRDLKDVVIAADPQLSSRFLAVASNPTHPPLCCEASGDVAYTADDKRIYAAYTQFQRVFSSPTSSSARQTTTERPGLLR